MTNEERIRYLKGLLKCELCEEESTKICKSCDNRRIGSSAKCYDALKEVIKALEQEPCEDCVSRQFMYELGATCIAYRNDKQELIPIISIDSLPPVTPQEPKTGRWIDDKCSVCGKGIEDLIDSQEWYRNEEPNFCPFCGTKIVDSQESEKE